MTPSARAWGRVAVAGAIAIAGALILLGGVLNSPLRPGRAPVAAQAASTPLATGVPAFRWGIYEPENSKSLDQVNRFAGYIGRSPGIVLFYSSWFEPFSLDFARQVDSIGALPLDQIDPYNIKLSAIAAGTYDAYLRAYADSVKQFGKRVIIGFAHEMNGSWYSWGRGRTPARIWVAAWQHIVTVFRGQGASNVIWMWTMNRTPRLGSIRDWWPGSSYVTWVGIDGYYFFPSDTFSRGFQPAVDAVRQLTGKPILLSEVGIGPGAGQAAKIPDIFAGMERNHLLGLVWFDSDTTHRSIYLQDWRLEGNPAGLAAFRREVLRSRK